MYKTADYNQNAKPFGIYLNTLLVLLLTSGKQINSQTNTNNITISTSAGLEFNESKQSNNTSNERCKEKFNHELSVE